MQRSLIRKLRFYEFELSHNVAEATKTICCTKVKGAVVKDKVTRWVKKFCSGGENLNDQAKLVRLKTGFRCYASSHIGKSGV